MARVKDDTGVPIPGRLVEFILLGPLDDRRQLQDSPILGDVWVEYGKQPDQRLDLLIAPYRDQHAGTVATAIDSQLGEADANISYLQGIVAAKLTFKQLLQFVVPKTRWWLDHMQPAEKPQSPSTPRGGHTFREKAAPVHKLVAYQKSDIQKSLRDTLESAKAWHQEREAREQLREPSGLERFAALTGLILWAADQKPSSERQLMTIDDQISFVLTHTKAEDLAARVYGFLEKISTLPESEPLVWQVSMNRRPVLALTRSIPAVKADAARTLFKVNCSNIGWAVLDSGIDGTHPAFYTADGINLRVKRSFDFTHYRTIVSLSNLRPKLREANRDLLLRRPLLQAPINAAADLEHLAEDARSRGPVRWELVERFVEIRPDTPPSAGHGTHVAGILGASKTAAEKHASSINEDFADGMCPDIALYDFRVLSRSLEDTEFAIIAALQFIRYLNERNNFPSIHGANLSLSIPHDVRNFACGRTPICVECERLVDSGVLVVAAAGNHGYKSFQTKEGSFDGYTAFSITDPGNTDGVITVGSTHRFWPHTYGVSFFSSRGPTGDGRLKPDLVAPGERIRAPLPGGHWGDLDGTSMAAPHVSGAAAMLMGRYSELIGRPRRIKEILCESATDLNREPSFQGRGMLDVLRAFQQI